MGAYKFIIFLQENKLSTLEVKNDNNFNLVGINGNEYYKCREKGDIDTYYNSMCEKYNVDDLSRLPSLLFLVNCGMEKELMYHLINKLKSCERMSVNDISVLLPISLSLKGLLKSSENIVVEFLEEHYSCICDNEYSVEKMIVKTDMVKHILERKDFAFIATWGADLVRKIDFFEDEINKKQLYIENQKKSYEEKIKTLVKERDEFKNQLSSYIEENKKINKELQEKDKQLKRLDEIEKDMNNLEKEVKTVRNDASFLYRDTNGNYRLVDNPGYVKFMNAFRDK